MATEQKTLKVLVVDDDNDLLSGLKDALTRAGEQVVACATFADGRQALKAQRFDALLIDVRLGDFNGLQLAHIGHEAQPHARIVMFSGYDDPVLQAEAEHLGATYVVKPVGFSRILELIREPQTARGSAGG